MANITIEPYKHQVEMAENATNILIDNKLVYIAAEERTGKSLTSLLIFENIKAKSLLIITKKKALNGWHDILSSFGYSVVSDLNKVPVYSKAIGSTTKFVTLVNYHNVGKLKEYKSKFSIAIIDEAHSYLSAYPKTGKLWADTKSVVSNLPLIFMSATPYAESLSQIYNQLRISAYSPFRNYPNFYSWHKVYGIQEMVRIPYGYKKVYNKVKDDLVHKEIDHLFISKTRKDLGFTHEPIDKVHYVEYSNWLKNKIKSSINDSIIKLSENDIDFAHNISSTGMEFDNNGNVIKLLDTPLSERSSIYMLEGGTLKTDKAYIILNNNEKIDYILKHFGDTDDLVIMYQFIAEKHKLEKYFRKALILQGDAYSEGVDLSHKKHLIIYSMSFSTSKYIQRRARQANINRKEPIIVNYILFKGGVDEAVYDTVVNKKVNFDKNSYAIWAGKLKISE